MFSLLKSSTKWANLMNWSGQIKILNSNSIFLECLQIFKGQIETLMLNEIWKMDNFEWNSVKMMFFANSQQHSGKFNEPKQSNQTSQIS